MTIDRDWIVPRWPAPANVHSLITTRAGGVSSGPYASLNLGTSTGDDAHAVACNRATLRAALPQEPLWLRQIHGNSVANADVSPSLPASDASVATRTGVVCAILVADCIPVLLTNRMGTIVGAAHCGWRGLASGVLAHTIAHMTARGAHTADLIAYLGPGIGAGAFEVGNDVRHAFLDSDPSAAPAFVAHGSNKWLCDLLWLARHALKRAGVHEVHGGHFCTYSDPERFYSYRRDKVTGRMAALIWREA